MNRGYQGLGEGKGDGGVGEELTEISSFAYVIVLHCSSVSKSHRNK